MPTSTATRVKPLTTDRSPTTPKPPPRTRKASPAATAPVLPAKLKGEITDADATRAPVKPGAQPTVLNLLCNTTGIGEKTARAALKTAGVDPSTEFVAEQVWRSREGTPGMRGRDRAVWIITGQQPSAVAAPTRTKPTQHVLDALTDHGPLVNDRPWDASLTAEQRTRALTVPDGLRGKAAVAYVLTGERPSDVARQREQERAADAAAGRSTRTSAGPRAGSALAAALTVLAASSEPMRPDDIYAEAKRLGLVDGLKGKTPAATLAAQLATANKAERYVMRPAPGVYALRPAP